MRTDIKRFVVAQGNRRLILSQTYAKVLVAIDQHLVINYTELTRITKIDKATLYVVASRLRKAKLIYRVGEGREVHWSIHGDITIDPATYVG